jgi:DNA-binding response OmpR family regulator/CRP-like cAMP-binding protein
VARIQIVEDEQLVALDIARCLETNGHVITGRAASADEALQMIERNCPDVALLDLVLEGSLDGVSLAAIIRDQYRIPIIFLTAHGDERTITRAQLAEPMAYLVKPFKDVDVLAAVKVALHRTRTQHGTETRARPVQRSGANAAPVSSQAEKLAFIRSIECLNGISDAELSLLADGCTVQTFEAGQTISPDAEGRHIPFVLIEGRVALVTHPGKDRKLILSLISPNDPFGLFAALDGLKVLGEISALRRSKVMLFPKTLFLTLLDGNPTLARTLTRDISGQLSTAHGLARSLASDSAVRRVGLTLQSLLPLLTPRGDGKETVVLDVTRTEIAELAGITLETAVRVLKSLEDQGIVKLDSRRFIEILEPNRLESIGLADGETTHIN